MKEKNNLIPVTDLKSLRPIIIETEYGEVIKSLWMATHAKEEYNYFAGIGDNSLEARENLTRLINELKEK